MENTEKNILVFLPCYNEAENCLYVLNELRIEKEKIERDYPVQFDILVINDGSIDNTAQLLADNHHLCDYSVLHLTKNRGYGFVLKTENPLWTIFFLLYLLTLFFLFLSIFTPIVMVKKRSKKKSTIWFRLFLAVTIDDITQHQKAQRKHGQSNCGDSGARC